MWYIAGMPIVERNYALVANSMVWTSLAVLVIALRLFTRGCVVKRLGMDDYLMTGAMAFSIGFLVVEMYQIKFGLGQPVNLETLIPFLAALYATVPCYNMSQTLYKLSITAQSYRIFTTPETQRRIQYMFGWILVCGIMSVSGSLFYCSPPAKAWDESIDGWCVNRSNLNYAIAGFNILNDMLLLAIPAPFILRLHIPQKQRVVLTSIFACGFFVTIVSIIRLKALYDNLNGPIDLQPVTGVDIALWSHLEINMAIIFLSVPAIQAFVTRVILGRNRLGDSYHNAGTPNASNSGSRAPRTIGSSATRNRHRNGGVHNNGGDDDEGDGLGYDNRLAIRVQQSIEMKSYPVDDTGSEKDLLHKQSFTPAIQNHATVSGGGGRSSDSEGR